MQAALGWVTGVLAERLWNGGGESHTTCHCEFSGPEPGSGVLEVLREQLGRCGLEHLQAVPCPTCPGCPPCPEGTSPFLLASLAGVVGFTLGVLLSLGWWVCASRRPALADEKPASEQTVKVKVPTHFRARRALSLQGQGQVRDGFETW